MIEGRYATKHHASTLASVLFFSLPFNVAMCLDLVFSWLFARGERLKFVLNLVYIIVTRDATTWKNTVHHSRVEQLSTGVYFFSLRV